ncbi:uncharacterized protein BO80DRAFT_448297 [Aspergillus ibericus CBS 121593]|uniref:F-box domain protein n=1 Tax=Aspergillus ibericus CBS 121593 TaxID=1448316 RepID=A0A395GQ48_9EURO|nr:hypothetical protein BO80DRAFT_448297 [Aspergillus ibericus CBS 121593]RAK97494.1 hypothetical protein BO80DRAFT_448297 [Aspergillus ibericus CBS 121593]
MSDYTQGPYAPIRSRSPFAPPQAPFSNPHGLKSLDSLASRSTLYFLPNDILEDHADDTRHLNKMPPKDVDDKLLLAGLETKWDAADRLAVPHLNIPKARPDDHSPPSPCHSYVSSSSSAALSPSASEWRFKPLPPVPGARIPDGLYSSTISTAADHAPSGDACIDIQAHDSSTTCSTVCWGTPADDTTSHDPDVIAFQTYHSSSSGRPFCRTISPHDTPYVLSTDHPATYHSSPFDAPIGNPSAHDPPAYGDGFSAPEQVAEKAWPQTLGLKTEQLPLFPSDHYGQSPNRLSPVDIYPQQKQPVKKSSNQELKQDSDDKPLWRTLKAGVRRVLTRKAVSHDGGAYKASRFGKNKQKNARRASIIVRMSTIPPIHHPPEDRAGPGFLDEKEEGHYEDAIKRMKNVLASLLEDGYSMDAILQAEANQQFLRSLFTRVQNEPLLGVDTGPPIPSPPTSHSSLPSDHTCSSLPHEIDESVRQPADELAGDLYHPSVDPLFDSPIPHPSLRGDNESSWEYVGYGEDDTFTEGAPSVRYFTGTAPDEGSEPRSSCPPFAAVMAALDDDLQRMTSKRWSLSKPGLEDMILHVLLQIDDLDDLFSFAQTSKATYHVFKRHELPLMENTIRRRSPAAWELRQMSDINQQADPQDIPSATVYYRAVTRDLRALATLKGLMMTYCRAVMRTSSYTALSRPSGPDARRLDNAIWRVWTFCFLFGMQTGRENDMDGQVSWLRGEVLSPFQPCPDPKDVGSILFDPPPGFGEGNPGGLSVGDMQDMDEIWTCLKYMLGFLRGETERARRFGVFQNSGIAPERNQGMIVLHEWINYLLTLGPEAVVELAPLGPDTHPETTFQRAMSRGWTTWEAPRPGGTRSAFLTDALGRVSGGLRRLEELQMTLWYNCV